MKGVFLEVVWSALSERRWQSPDELKAALGVDESTLMRIVDFLVRWGFAEVRRFPSLDVRRKSGAASPTDVVDLLRAVKESPQAATISKRGFRLAERVACRACGGRSLREIGENEVECTTCHERQWFAVEFGKERAEVSGAPRARRSSLLERLLARVAFSEEDWFW